MRLKNRRAKRARKNQRERERESRRRKESVLRTPLSLSVARAERKRRLFFRAGVRVESPGSSSLYLNKMSSKIGKKKCGSRLETLNPTPTHKRSKGILLLLLLYEDVKNVLVQQHSERALRRGFRPLGVDDLSLGDWR